MSLRVPLLYYTLEEMAADSQLHRRAVVNIWRL